LKLAVLNLAAGKATAQGWPCKPSMMETLRGLKAT
jgi:hypothetical protein